MASCGTISKPSMDRSFKLNLLTEQTPPIADGQRWHFVKCTYFVNRRIVTLQLTLSVVP